MHFKLRYVMEGFNLELGQQEILKFSLEDSVAVHILRLVDETNPSGTKLVCNGICERNVDSSVRESFQRFSAGGPLDAASQALYGQILSDL